MLLVLTTFALTALSLAATPAFAHGGAYRGPGGEIPGESRTPSDPPPPPEGDGPGTPGGDNDPNGPNTGDGGDGGNPNSGEGGGTPGGGGGNPPPASTGGDNGAPNTGGGRRKSSGPGYEDWTFWWNYNKDSLLELKRLIRERGRVSATGQGVHGLAPNASKHGSLLSATEGAVKSQIVPVLMEILNADPRGISADIQSAAELALAKIGETEIVPKLREIAENEGGRFDVVTVESASLAFGLLQHDAPEVRDFLLGLATDTKRGARFSRPFAAVSLGLVTNQPGVRTARASDAGGEVGQALLGIVKGKESGKDVKPAALLALGLLEDERHTRELFDMVRTERAGAQELSDNELAHAISSLGRVGRAGFDAAGEGTAIADFLLDLVTGRKAREKSFQNALRSSAIALGQIGGRCGDVALQRRILAGLRNAAEETDDSQEKHFALIAIGRMGAGRGVDAKVRDECVAALRHDLDKGRGLTPAFAALGMAVVGKSMQEARIPADDEQIRKPVRERFEDEKNARTKGAYAIASGLLRDPLAIPALRRVLRDGKADSRLRGYAALGLGMIGTDAAARDDVKHVLANETDKDLRVQAAIAAGLLADATVIDPLLAILGDANQSQYVLGSVALALGQLGDERAISELVRIVRDARAYPDITRALAVVALGQIGDRRDTPVLSRVSTDFNYRDQASYEVELLTIL